MVELSLDEARRLALSSLGLSFPRPAKPGIAHLRKMVARTNAIQIDSVNVLVRAHYMPAFSRLGPYAMSALDDLVHRRRELFEYIAHAACFIPTSLYPLSRWRMEAHRNAEYWIKADKAVKRYVESVYADVAERGPLSASEVKDAGKSTGNWWGWSQGKQAIETLWRMGRVSVAGRRGFERLYDVTERVIPSAVLAVDAPSSDVAQKELLVLGARALGVGTALDVARYFNLQNWWERETVNGKRAPSQVKRFVAELVEEGRLVPARVEGWKQTAYVVPGRRVPPAATARALVSPFDPVMWERRWTKAVFDFDYKIEIYVPAPKRVYGYYCLPFLLGDRFVARVDLKADRKLKTLLVPGAFVEAKVEKKHVASELAAELREMARWLELDRIEVGDRGDLAKPLRKALE